MANKLYAMEQLTEEVAKDVAASPQEWMRFLNTASRLYKYTFPEQLLIYAQRPEATAVASMEIWNQKMYRWIKKGSKGIALIDNTSGPKTKLRYVFDVQDTYKVRNLGKDPQLWNLPVEGEQLVADYLQEQLSLEDTEGGLAESLHQAAKESMQEWLPDALEELRLDVTGTFLEELDEQNQEVEFRELMTNSVWYVLLKRCELDVQEYLDAEDFRHITDFNQLKVLGHLGSAVNEISRPVLMQIGRYVLNNLENDLKTVAKEKEVVYNEFNTLIRESGTNKTEDREENKEETDYERDHLQPERRVSDSRYQPGRDERNDREIWNDEERVSEKSQGSKVQHSDSAEPSGQSSDGDRQSGKTESRQPDERTSGERSGTGQDARHNGVDQTHEPDQSTGRGTGDSGDYLQLSLFPTEEEQLGEIRKAAAALEQPAAFLISDEVVDDILRTGSGQKNTLFHITARLIEGLDNEEMQSFLKDEYRTGGKGFTIDGQKISIWYDNDGIRIRRGDSARRNFDRIVTWEEAADRIRDMYEEGNYVDNLISNNAIEQEQKEMTDLLALHFRDTSRNREEQLSYSDWQDVVGAAWTDPEEAATTAYRFEWLQEDMEKKPEDYHRWEIQHNPEYFQRYKDFQRERSWVDQQFKVERPALSFITQDEIDAVLRRGGITAGGRNRIYEYFMEHHDMKDAAEFLKNEYGTGGSSPGIPGADASDASHDAKGLKLGKGKIGNPEVEVLLKWNKVAERVRQLIRTDDYLSPEEMEKYEERQEVQRLADLEPSMGVGNFFGKLPENLNQSKLYGVELDSISGRIAKLLYPDANIQIKGFEKTDYPNDFFDVAIGNVPFGAYKVNDRQYDRYNFMIHDYFLAKTIDQLRPGGVAALITTKGTMDKASPEVRKYLAERADLLWAIRLPNTAFKANAGTEVSADILFFQKRESFTKEMPDWVNLESDANGITINKYFVQHPGMILGEMKEVSGPYGMETTCAPMEGAVLELQLQEAVKHIKGSMVPAVDVETELDEMTESIPVDPNVRNYSYTVVDLGADALGNITRINNLLESYPEKLAEAEQKLGTVQEQLANAKEEVGKPFPKEEELNQKLGRLSELNALLNMDEREDAEAEVYESDEKEERPARGSIHEKLQIYKEKSQRESETGKENRKRDFGLE